MSPEESVMRRGRSLLLVFLAEMRLWKSRAGATRLRFACLTIALSALAVGNLARADEHRPREHRGADPAQLVRPDGSPVANGCGPGWATGLNANSWRFANRHTYRFGGEGFCEGLSASDPSSCDGETWTYSVDFRDACNLHDVGYEGNVGVIVDGKWESRLVYDRILDEDVDVSRLSRAEIDERFYRDMEGLCIQQIVQQEGKSPFAERAWASALESCKGKGQRPTLGGSWGADMLFGLVRMYGDRHFKDLDGTRMNDKIASGRWAQ
jgi:hypothetical protein